MSAWGTIMQFLTTANVTPVEWQAQGVRLTVVRNIQSVTPLFSCLHTWCVLRCTPTTLNMMSNVPLCKH